VSHDTIVLSVPTAGKGASAAATFLFFTRGYQAAHQGRASAVDTVVNQNGVFQWYYDNGPGPLEWSPFEIICSDRFSNICGGGATQQKANLDYAWQYIGRLGLQDPLGSYQVLWAPGQALERGFRAYPKQIGDPLEMLLTVQFVEG
jgi:hypothetical protein